MAWTIEQIEQTFLGYMERNGHVVIEGHSVRSPTDDVLFTTAGMHPLTPYLKGEPHPDGTRLTDVQRCVRTTDVDEVGDNTHLTVFEMLGNWSLGDYFKETSIPQSFGLLTGEFGIDPLSIYVTVFAGAEGLPFDDEAAAIWEQTFADAGVDPKGRINPLVDNWWSNGPVGLCGPDTEIFVYVGDDPPPPFADIPEYVEIWNNVFMTFDRAASGDLTQLTKRNVDTGMGLERLALFLDDHTSVWEIDELHELTIVVGDTLGVDPDQTDADQTRSLRIVTDHLRAALAIAAAGIQPSASRQGYVLRKLIRRAVRHAELLKGTDQGLAQSLVESTDRVSQVMGRRWPDVGSGAGGDAARATIEKEAGKFSKTLKKGTDHLQELADDSALFDGDLAFRLADTLGYPVELSAEEATRIGMTLDPGWEERYEVLREEQRARSHAAEVTGSVGSVGEDLFANAAADRLARQSPLAARLRPRSLDDVVGQDQLLAKGRPLRALIEADRLTSVILWGPPGTGKTTLARLIADATNKAFEQLSAVNATVKDVREVIERARHRLGEQGQGTILFLDEIHRFNKAQQDALLPSVEDGLLVLVGATTENPFFEVNPPLRSRATLFRLEPLTPESLATLADRGLAAEGATADRDAIDHLTSRSSGDGRQLLTSLEVAIALASTRRPDSPVPHVQLLDAEDAIGTRALRYGRDDHYDVISAFIKSIRGSDADAGIYWLARMLEAGEDARYIARRLVILASEDVGMADPQSLLVANAAAHAVEFVGLPEAQLNLAQAVVHLATAAKSNRVAMAIWTARDDVRKGVGSEVPTHLRDSHYQGAKVLGHGQGYDYPHDDPRGWVPQDYRPAEAADRVYYDPSDHGYEVEVRKRMDQQRADGRREDDR